MSNLIDTYKNYEIDLEKVTCLFKKDNYEIFWLGIDNETAFRCNVYLIKSGNEAIIVDPGSRAFFEVVKKRALQVVKLEEIKAIIVCHQDPDVCASMIDWLEILPNLKVITTERTNVLLPHYGKDDYEFFNINTCKKYIFKSGEELEFIEAPFLHFSGAFATYDKTSNFLFSGDIWAALDVDWELVVSDFDKHISNMNLFHIDYMASNLATRGFVNKIKDKKIEAILPQHGSIINSDYVQEALTYLKELKCGLDIIYGDISGCK
ncbi:MBL fold metallo-hydrolase [Malaciobacter mytili]|uniref:MBL fold metallo-hydrolase n=1 Tax=Malaciobacter mytili LMG 24559 TaxID=1032238 RepID=A0AAX2AI10_9BACT|nr:MBL fold metallo-hydrolase [Malaciobacter mytili]AXH16000.1 flavodiiron family protein (MBL-fold metallo-hydrolase domain) [Malaciobacter mytili LMG 24559]RXI37122.1 MBL fold metallo-hydrolase [Malaciobacter mytili]RXK15814.1 MBL fold metallo-hydrolase [Malaciobacter mytili LMG 24559]